MQTVKGYMGSISFDGDMVVIDKKMRGAVRVPVASIQSISVQKAGLGMKGVRFAVAGGTEAKEVAPHGSHKDLALDPYALTFRSKALSEFEALIDDIESARAN